MMFSEQIVHARKFENNRLQLVETGLISRRNRKKNKSCICILHKKK